MKAIQELSFYATSRNESLFNKDIQAQEREIRSVISGARILVIGGAGSIGSATIKEFVRFVPAAIHVIDLNENSLVELVRDLRGSPQGLLSIDFRALPLDYGSQIFHRFLVEQGHYDVVMNFAALKHVRSEKDVFSLLQMIDTNVIKQVRLLDWLEKIGGSIRYFSVSTDKASNPVNLMGATKRLMEHIIFDHAIRSSMAQCVTSARFANVAFSEGSLLHGWTLRLAKRQPLPVPSATRRYFISLREAGQLCLLASTCGCDGMILIPKMDATKDLKALAEIAKEYLASEGLRAREYTDETEAKGRVSADMKDGFYPLLITLLDTNGEKPFEEFVGEGETVTNVAMEHMQAILYLPGPDGAILRFLQFAEHAVAGADPLISKTDIIRALQEVIPHMRHRETRKQLDDRL